MQTKVEQFFECSFVSFKENSVMLSQRLPESGLFNISGWLFLGSLLRKCPTRPAMRWAQKHCIQKQHIQPIHVSAEIRIRRKSDDCSAPLALHDLEWLERKLFPVFFPHVAARH